MSSLQPRSRSEQRRREVVEAARRVIMRNGLEAASLRDIAREGGFTTGVLSHYFADKQAVIAACFQATSEDFMGEAEAALERAGSPAELVQTFIRFAVPDTAERRGEWRVWAEMWCYAPRDGHLRETLIETDARWEAMIARFLLRAQAEALVHDWVEPDMDAAVLARLIDGVGLRGWLSGRWDAARAELVRQLALLGVPWEILDTTQAAPRGGAEEGSQ